MKNILILPVIGCASECQLLFYKIWRLRWFCTVITILLNPFAQAYALSPDPAPTPVPVMVEKVKQYTFSDVSKEVGKINAIDSAGLTFNAGGKVAGIYFKDGDKVKKGQLIAKLDDSKVMADLNKAKSRLFLARADLSRTQDLLAKEPGAISRKDFDTIQGKANDAYADVQQKQAVMKDYSIRAPFEGQLASFTLSIGNTIASGTVLVKLFNLDSVEVRYAISQDDFSKAKKGQHVIVTTMDANKGIVFEGVVNYVAPVVDQSTGRVVIHAVLENPDKILVPGMFVNIRQIFKTDVKRLAVPQNSVIADNSERYVWLVNGNHVSKKPIKLGKNMNNGYVIVDEGLTRDDVIVKTGVQKLSDNSIVNIIPSLKKNTVSTQSDKENR